jgi:hypothetical protein
MAGEGKKIIKIRNKKIVEHVGIQNLKRTAWSTYSITCGWNSKFENMAGENV